MGQRNIRVVVGQGGPGRQGFLRTVLEDDGFNVVGEAGTTSQLARLLTEEQPDIVVLDDGIGVAAVQLATEIAPKAKLIVVWPAAVVPISGAVRVDPSEVLTSLAATVTLAAGGIMGLGSIERPDWIEKIRKDPATLRELLAQRGGVPTRPSVTELQRRGHHLHPSPGAPRRGARPKPKPEKKKADKGVVTPIPLATAAAATVPSSEAAWNRRLGVIALGGAAVAGALMLALALGPRSQNVISADPLPRHVHVDGPTPQDLGGTETGQTPGGGDNNHPGGTGGGTSNGGTTTGGTSGGGSDKGSDIHGMLGGPTGGPGGNNGGTGGQDTGTTGGPRSSQHLPGSNGNRQPTGTTPVSGPGNSGSNNPHGGPPGWDHRTVPDHAGGRSSHVNAHANEHAHKR